MTYQPPGGPPPPPQQPWQQPPVGAPYPASAYGTPGYGYAPPPQAKPLKGLATAIVVLLIISALAGVFAAVSFFHRASVVSDFQTSVSFSALQDVKDADDQVRGAVGVTELLLLATGIVWIIWQFRLAKNALAVRGNYGLAPGWAIGGWFIPIGSWVLPQLQLFQAAKAIDPDLPRDQPASAGRAPSAVLGWWVAYAFTGVLFLISSVTRPSENSFDFDIDKFARADRVAGVACLLLIVTGVLAILVVRSLTDRDQRVAASLPSYQQPYAQGYQQPGQPYPQAPAPGQYPPPAAPPQTWQTPAPNQTWQPPPAGEPWQPPPTPPPSPQ